jgi:hypothetical protein
MKKLIERSSLLAVLALFCLAPFAFAQEPMTLTAPNPNYSWDDTYYNEDVSVGPYVATVNGVANQQIICDDYADSVSVGDSWKVSVMNFASLTTSNLGSTMWGATLLSQGAQASTVLTDYLEAAWLTEQLIGQKNGAIVAAIQYAEWAIFNPNAKLGGPQGTGITSYSYWYNLALSQTNLSASEFANLDILTPLNSNGTACKAGSSCKQEYFMLVPEGGTAAMYLLLAGFSCFGAMLLRSRRQKIGIGIA